MNMEFVTLMAFYVCIFVFILICCILAYDTEPNQQNIVDGSVNGNSSFVHVYNNYRDSSITEDMFLYENDENWNNNDMV